VGLVLVRHTRPDIADGTCYGRLDLPVADTFEVESNTVLSKLTAAEVLVSSPLQRCRCLADKIGAAFDLAVVIDDRLREMDFGSWEGVLWDEIPRDEINQWRDDFYYARPHGGESVEMLVERVQSALADYQKANKTYIVVCHAGIIKVATSDGTASGDFSTSIPFGGIMTLNTDTPSPDD